MSSTAIFVWRFKGLVFYFNKTYLVKRSIFIQLLIFIIISSSNNSSSGSRSYYIQDLIFRYEKKKKADDDSNSIDVTGQ